MFNLVQIDAFAQVGLAVLGIAAIFLVAKKNKWGFVVGLISQPFWILTGYINNQWGVMLVGFAYTILWIYGIHEWFFVKKKP